MRYIALLAPALAAATPVLVFPGSGQFPADAPEGGNAPNGFSPAPGTGTADSPNPNEIQIISASFSGNGCPQGSVSTSISPDKTVSTAPARREGGN